MNHALFLLLVALCVALGSCKRQPARIAPDGERAAATQPAGSSATAPPASQPAPRPVGAKMSDEQLLQFIAISRQIVQTRADRGKPRSPEDFAALASTLQDDEAVKRLVAAGNSSSSEWMATGTRAWAAWSVAQVDYNAEAPLRENAKREAAARAKLASAEATIKAGVRVLSDEERGRLISAARDAAADANDRAGMWAEKAGELREQIAAANDVPQARPDASPAILVARADVINAAGAARSAMQQELAATERNEQQARADARRAEATAGHPQTPLDDSGAAELRRQSQEAVEQAKAEIAGCEEEAALLKTRLSEDRRVNSDSRQKTAPEADIVLLRKHLAEFNNAWGMTVEGRGK